MLRELWWICSSKNQVWEIENADLSLIQVGIICYQKLPYNSLSKSPVTDLVPASISRDKSPFTTDSNHLVCSGLGLGTKIQQFRWDKFACVEIFTPHSKPLYWNGYGICFHNSVYNKIPLVHTQRFFAMCVVFPYCVNTDRYCQIK